MKKLFLLAWPIALAAVSCSNEEVVSVNNDANEIKFAVTAENATRAQNVFCNVNLPTEFHVWAAVDNKQYFAGVQYKKTGDNYTAKGGEVHFWPTTGTAVDFYAVTEETTAYKAAVPGVGEDPGTPEVQSAYFDWANATGSTHKFNWNAAGGSTITWETRGTDAPALTDLLYAYTKKPRPAGTTGVVPMNFRHALSQIVFKAQNTNKTIAVEIDKVDVVNIAKGGTFTMPSVVTNGNIEDHTTGGTYPDDNSVGKWSGWSTQNVTYTTTSWTPAKTIKSDLTNLTDETGVNKNEEQSIVASHQKVAHSLLLVPQETTAWVPGSPKKATESDGSYFIVYCRIQNVAASNGNATADDLYLWGNAGATAAVYIPFKADWEPGKKYIYTFKFGENTNGGYDPNGDPVLIPISFTVTVDDFVKVSTANDNIPME